MRVRIMESPPHAVAMWQQMAIFGIFRKGRSLRPGGKILNAVRGFRFLEAAPSPAVERKCAKTSETRCLGVACFFQFRDLGGAFEFINIDYDDVITDVGNAKFHEGFL